MREYPTHTWNYVVASFRDLAATDTAFTPMRDAVEHLATSPFAAGLYPVLSMYTVRLYQHDHAGAEDEEVRLDFESGEFVVRHRTGATPDPRFALQPTPGVWTKRGPDAIALLERAFHHLSWFVAYRAPRPADPHPDAAV